MSSIADLPQEEQQRILDSPALLPPTGVDPSFENPPNNNGLAIAIITVTLALVVPAVMIRVWSRTILLRKVKVEDFLTLTAFGTYVGTNFYLGAILSIKTAILLEWLRIFVPLGTRNAFFWLCWILISLNVLPYVTCVFLENFQCSPLKAVWDFTVAGHCLSSQAKQLQILTAALNLASDTAILLLPQKVVWSLNMSKKQKLGASFIFAIGLLTCALAIIRVKATIDYVNGPDITYLLSTLSLTIQVEMSCLLLVICIPTAPKALPWSCFATRIKKILQSWRPMTTRSNTHTELAEDRSLWPIRMEPLGPNGRRQRCFDDLPRGRGGEPKPQYTTDD
ncbi:uncharacterized protein F4822DRAFT_444849 [Hypoxylon trugodes]|uniref:uncharacterized protein n=1 Tax=Hypoxylon trugodes TaxID=326681 RepID=UPI002192FEE8|nr:uncharacterized protein F4822DRAFT_444849 [Hypoxylon trugodes]KAI1386461.1 hypothetical protein F4822DRAFT_444849 [Hypoxylon trugodes]